MNSNNRLPLCPPKGASAEEIDRYYKEVEEYSDRSEEEKKRLREKSYIFGILSIVLFLLVFVIIFTNQKSVIFTPQMVRYTQSPVYQNNIQAAHVNFDVKHWVDLADDLGYDWGELFGNSMQPTFFEGNIVIEKRYDGEEIKTGQLLRFYRLNETQTCKDIEAMKERDNKQITLKINDLSVLKKDNVPVGYQLTYTKNMSSCVMLYRYEGNDFWITEKNQFCLDGTNTAQIFNLDGISEGSTYRLCRPSGGICSDLFTARSLGLDSKGGGSFTGNDMAVIHRVAAVYDNTVVMQGDNLYEEETIDKCQITHVVVGIMFT